MARTTTAAKPTTTISRASGPKPTSETASQPGGTATPLAAKTSKTATAPATKAAMTTARAVLAGPPARRKAKAPALKAITLRQFASGFAEEKGMKRAEGIAMVEEIVGKIRAHIVAGTKVRIQGLGNFEIRSRAARMGRNPATGAAIKIAASRKLVFTPAAELKEAV